MQKDKRKTSKELCFFPRSLENFSTLFLQFSRITVSLSDLKSEKIKKELQSAVMF